MEHRPALTGGLTGGLFAFAVLAAADNLTWSGARLTLVVLVVVGAVGRIAVNRLRDVLGRRGASERAARIASTAAYGVLLLVVFVALRLGL